jgi:signal transduction histidine kinase
MESFGMTSVLFGLQSPVLLALSACAGYAMLMVLVVRRRGWHTANSRWLIVYLLLSALWTVGLSLTLWIGLREDVPLIGARAAADILLAMSPMLGVLSLMFLERPGSRWVALLGGLWLILISMLEFNPFNIQPAIMNLNIAPTIGETLRVLRTISWAGFSAGIFLLVLLDYLQIRRPLHRNRILFWLIALTLIISGEALALLDKTRFLFDVVQVGLALRFVGAIVLTVAAVSYHLPILRTFVRQAVAVIISTLIIGALIFGGMVLVMSVAAQADPISTVLLATGAALVLAILQQPVRALLQRWTDQFLTSGRYDPARALRDYGDAISNILDLDTLVTVAIGIVAEAMDVRRGALMLITDRDETGVDVQIMSGMGALPIDRADFSANSPIMEALRRGDMPLTQYEIDILPQFRVAPPRERTWLQALDMEVYVPIRSQGFLIGVFSLGRKESGEPYTAQDLDVLTTVGNQTATVLQNARLVSDLKGANRSITNLNDDLTTSNRRLEKLDLAKTDFIEIASHELRTPLTQIRGYSDILADVVKQPTANPAHMAQISQGITRASQRLEEIITAMLDVSRIDSQALNIHTTPISMAVVMKMALDIYKDAIRDRKMKIAATGVEDLPPVQGDLQRLCQAFANLIGNAIKFTPDGGSVAISGRSFVEDSVGHQLFVEILITDTGIGIDVDDQVLIFEKFYRVGAVELHSTGSTKFKGAGPGLGLPISKGVIKVHGGKLWVESEGHDEERMPGSTFHVLLPAIKIPASDNGSSASQN